MPTLTRDGVDLHYTVHGSGPPILLSHGYSSTSHMWERQSRTLGRTYRVITWDMRGHGLSDSPADPELYSEAHTVADMAALLDALDIRSAHIGGLSLGGYMSLAFHLRHPERVTSLLLFDTGPGYRSDAARDSWNERSLERAGELDLRGLEALGSSAEVRHGKHRSAAGLAHAARGMLAQSDDRVIAHLASIRVPTLVLVGADDRPFLAATDYMATKIPGAQKVVVPGAGHASNLDQPEIFEREVTAFLGSLTVATS